jgi:hypothetical protein
MTTAKVSIRMEIEMHKKRLLTMLLSLFLMIIPFVAYATTITSCTFDKDTYHQGQTGYITVTMYNDEDSKIKVTELTATIDYYYTDGNIYLQTFYTNATLPVEIQQGQSNTWYIPFSLPTNIASGYTSVHVKAKTQLWNNHSETWFTSDHPTYQPTLYIESPYKQQLEEQQIINNNTTTMVYLFAVTTILFASMTGFLVVLNRRARVINQPVT